MNITIKNYEEYALDYLEERLQGKELRAFESFLEDHPGIREELESLSSPVFPETEEPEYPGKEALLRDPAIVRAFRRPLYVPIWTVAACLILLFGFFIWWNATGPGEKITPSLAEESVQEEQREHNAVVKSSKEDPSGEWAKSETGELSPQHSSEQGTKTTVPEPDHPAPDAIVKSTGVQNESGNEPAAQEAPKPVQANMGEEVLTTEEESPPDRRDLHPLERLENKRNSLLTGDTKQLAIVESIPDVQWEEVEEEDAYSLSDELANLAPTSWPGEFNTRNLKEAFIPKAFRK